MTDYGSFDESTLTSLQEELTKTGDNFEPLETKYVCHTSTIPLATIFDQNKNRNDINKFDWSFHTECKNSHCMFYHKAKNKIVEQFTPRNCPCNKDLKQICWISIMKKLKGLSNGPFIDAREVSFCPDARNILEDQYPSDVKGKANVNGFEEIRNHEDLIEVLNETYWFARHAEDFKVHKHIKKLWNSCSNAPDPSRRFRELITSIFGTLNGLIVKKIVFLVKETSNYKKLAELTCQAFRSLCDEYGAKERNDLDDEERTSLFEDAKKFFQHIKSYFNHENVEIRKRVFQYKFRNKILKNFFIIEMKNLEKFCTTFEYGGKGDYTSSLLWQFKMSHLSQTRTLDHLPFFVAREQLETYIKMMTREIYEPNEELLNLVHTAVIKNLKDNGVEEGLYTKEGFKADLDPKMIKESVSLELTQTASLNHTVSEGGKLEDARIFLRTVKENEWQFAIRNLQTGAIDGYTQKITDESWDEKGVLDLSSILFWGSMQIATNFLAVHGWVDEKWYEPMLKDGKEWYDEKLVVAKMLGIEEPGKLRILLKTNSFLNWSLTVGSKLLQHGLATHPDHKAGLELGSQDWNFAKRLSGESPESGFLYDLKGILKDEAHFGQTDWSKATDLLAKLLGFQMMKSYMIHTQFPEWYGMIILELTRLPFEVKETNYVSREGEVYFSLTEEHLFKEGFMMGVQVTKTYLHLAHVAAEGLATLWLERRGFVFDFTRRDLRIPKDSLLPGAERPPERVY